jgi:CubicO group peptidase (beta-lactamase class C family)
LVSSPKYYLRTNFEKIKIKDLLTMSSGLAWSEGNASGGQYSQMLQVMDQKGGMDVILTFLKWVDG